MRIIVGYGNDLRGEDGFGVDVIKELQSHTLKDTKLIETYQLTPEICLELLDAKKLIFIDAAFSNTNHYKIACHLEYTHDTTNLSHHISPKVIISLLNNVYEIYPEYEIYSMFTNQFDVILDNKKYKDCLDKTISFLSRNN